MTRILPRLIDKITAQAKSEKNYASPSLKRKKKPKSLYKPVLPVPSVNPTEYSQASLLLAPRNPIVNAKNYIRHKTLPPRPSFAPTDPKKLDPPRQMNEKEFEWWANPYLRMLTSPLRKCAITGRHLPSDLLVRLVPLRVPASVVQDKKRGSQPASVLIPDGLLHPKYAARQRSGGAVYTLCWRQILLQTTQKGFHNPTSPGVVASPRIHDHVAHLLRLRVLQELELLAEKLENAVRCRLDCGSSDSILRLLTKEEWESINSTGALPYDNAAAVLVVPPVDEGRIPNMSALPPDDEEYPAECPPVSTLLPMKSHAWSDELRSTLHVLRIPLYNGMSAFPSRSQRATLHALLLRVVNADRSYKLINSKRESVPSSTSEQGSDVSNTSHVFLLCSDSYTAKRGDTAAVALALWRLRMFESEGWMNNDR
ncbi:hypothetical protein BDN70DRAFT_214299 [Pholiota conissans]|uniref:Uncharacterized protein n=1 Tax=Pholiota conissans TaxID=109636 RepID=A0A9P6D4Y1_9AGAR|nr:hypothetical protein BDN70DRAFT_214299 [Pholiota conissans]